MDGLQLMQSFIKGVLKLRKPSNEIEFKLGSYIKNTTDNSYRYYPGVNNRKFVNFMSYIEKEKLIKPVEEETVVKYYPGDIRGISLIKNGKVVDGSTVYEKKTKLENRDVHFYNVSVRLSLSSEDKIQTIPSGVPYFVRLRKRYTYSFEKYSIDCTYTEDSNDKKTYEIELEMKENFHNEKDLYESFNMLLKLYLPENNRIIELSEYMKVASDFNNLFSYIINKNNIKLREGTLFRYGNKPRNLKREDIQKLNFDYSVTNKLNGESVFVLFTDMGVYILNDKRVDRISNYRETELNGTLLQAEYFKNTIHVFDCIKFKGRDVTREYLQKRLYLCKESVDRIVKYSIVPISVKKFLYGGSMKKHIKDIKEYMDKTYPDREDNDGMIFTPTNQPYINKDTLKFKFPELMSIDFGLEKDCELKETEDYMYCTPTIQSKEGVVPFDNKNGNDKNIKIRIDKKNKWKILSSDIVECIFKNGYFIPIRVRDDKTSPNFISVAKDVLDDMLHPLELDELIKRIDGGVGDESKREVSLVYMKDFNNEQKKRLILKYTEDKNVLDLGFGRGGDISKYIEAKARFVWGVEPYMKNYTDAVNRISKCKNPSMFKLLNLEAQESGKIKDEIKQKVDVISSFFSLTFFFENEKELDKFINTVSSNLKINGVFIGTTVDGDKLLGLLKNKRKVEDKLFSIEKLYEDEDRKIGKKIKFDIKDSIVSEQYEYLVFFDILEQKLKRVGLELVETSYFEPPKSMDSSNYLLSSISRSFSFIRVETENEKKYRLKAEEQKRIQIEESKNTLPMEKIEKTTYFKNYFTEDKLVRTGTVGDGSCMFHSILRAIAGFEYALLTDTQKRKVVKDIREKLSEKIKIETWSSLGRGELAIFLCSERINNLIEKKYPELYESFLQLSEKNIDDLIEKISTLSEKNTEIRRELEKIKVEAFQKYREDLKNCRTWVGEEYNSINAIEYLSDVLDIDIYIIRDKTRRPYSSDCNVRYKNRDSVIVLWVGDSHYECVGRLKGKKVERVFKPDDELIKTIQSIIC